AETGNFVVKVRFPNQDAKLRANTVVRVQVMTQPEKKRLTIPVAALYEDQEPPMVIVAEDVTAKKNAEGKEEKFAKAKKLRALVLTTALLVLGGVYSATRMPSGVYPEVTFPRIGVVAKKPGLDVRSMELQITIPLEQAVRTVLGVARVRSSTIRGGSALSIDY